MGEMYAMSLDIHLFSVISLMAVAIVMMILHRSKTDFDPLVKKIQGVTILHLSLLAFVLLTGAVMMAAQHLSFTPANLLMTVAVFIIFALEIKRNRALVKTVKHAQIEPDTYKNIGFKYYAVELVLISSVSVFSQMAA